MQTRRAPASSPLAILLPHPPLPRRTSSLLSVSTAGSPRTPRSCGSPANSIFVPPPPNRRSTDSWNSSNADELEWDWKPEQVLLLSRTLDALPAHLVTPFNGPIPPSNLLDKIARGVSQAKGPTDWPHSLRATRVKLIELARQRAKEQAAADQRRDSIAEEPEDAMETETNYTYNQDGREKPLRVAAGAKRPLYRQSSMDFMLNAEGSDIKNNEHLARLSSRLQRAERQAAHHPYQRSTRANRCTSPSPSSAVPSLVTPSTPSSSTLNTLSSLSLPRRSLRRTVSSVSSSSLSIISSSSEGVLPNPRVQRLMQDDSFAPLPPPKDTPSTTKVGAKRAPSFGTLAQEARREYLAHSPENGHSRKNSGTCPSSDEEEKVRTKHVKKARKFSSPSYTGATPPPESPAPMTPTSSPIVTRRGTSKPKDLTLKPSKSPRDSRSENQERSSKDKKENLQSLGKGSKAKPSTKPLPMNLQRNPSMFGPELPAVHNAPLSPAPVISTRTARSPSPTRGAPRALASAFRQTFSPPPTASSPALSKTPLLSPPADIRASPASVQGKTLRRVRRLAPARRISFSSLVPPGDEADADGEGDGEEKGGCIELGSAFQLH